MTLQWRFFKFFSRVHVWVYRRTNGHIGSRLRGEDVLLLMTVGRKSGQARITPLAYLRDGADYIIAGGAAGSTKHPDWYWNAVHGIHPVHIQVKNHIMLVMVIDTQNSERDSLEQRFLAHSPQFITYKRQAKRVIPILRLIPHTDTD